MDSLIKTVLLRTFCFLSWMLFSAWLFSKVEYTDNDNIAEKYNLLLSLYHSMASKYNVTIEEFNNFSNLVHQALNDPKPQWTYVASLDFVFQALTTIGYGYITPQTPLGQMLSIFVCLLGIPITLLALKSIGELIAKLVNTAVTKVEKKIIKRAEPKHVEIKSAVILFSVMVLLLLMSTWISMIFWDLTFAEGLYFWFITFTTIGFGDYTPFGHRIVSQSIKSINTSDNHVNKEKPSDAEQTTVFVFLDAIFLLKCMMGLCVMSSVLNSIMATLDLNERKCQLRCPGCVPRRRENHVSNDQCNTTHQAGVEMSHTSMGNAGFQKENMGSVSVNEIKLTESIG